MVEFENLVNDPPKPLLERVQTFFTKFESGKSIRWSKKVNHYNLIGFESESHLKTIVCDSTMKA